MSDSKPAEPASGKINKTSFLVSLCTAFSILANRVEEGVLQELAVVFASPAGYVVYIFLMYIYKEYQHRKAIEKIKGFIKDHQEELNQPGLTKAEKDDLKREIKEKKKLIEKRELDNIDLKLE